MGFLTIFYKYIIQQYFIVTAPVELFRQYKTNKISNAGTCTPTEGWKREAMMGCLTIFYNIYNPAPGDLFSLMGWGGDLFSLIGWGGDLKQNALKLLHYIMETIEITIYLTT